MSYRLDANGNLVPVDPFLNAGYGGPVTSMDQVGQLSAGNNWLAQVQTPGSPPGGMGAGLPPPAAGGFMGGLQKLGGWFGKNGQTIGNIAGAIGQGVNAYVGLQQLGLAKDALRFEKKAFKTNLANQVDSYNTQMGDRTTGRWYATEEERQAALKEAELPQGMRG